MSLVRFYNYPYDEFKRMAGVLYLRAANTNDDELKEIADAMRFLERRYRLLDEKCSDQLDLIDKLRRAA